MLSPGVSKHLPSKGDGRRSRTFSVLQARPWFVHPCKVFLLVSSTGSACISVSLLLLCHSATLTKATPVLDKLQTRLSSFLDQQDLIALQRVKLGSSCHLCLKFLSQITISFQSLTKASAPIIAKLAFQALMSCRFLYCFTWFHTLQLRSSLSCAPF